MAVGKLAMKQQDMGEDLILMFHPLEITTGIAVLTFVILVASVLIGKGWLNICHTECLSILETHLARLGLLEKALPKECCLWG